MDSNPAYHTGVKMDDNPAYRTDDEIGNNPYEVYTQPAMNDETLVAICIAIG